ncbi:MAG: hypothetical protein LBP75_06480 [Planctomycetota bacterium]|nr:hypothetical protein [Planctomycetota bacterium]
MLTPCAQMGNLMKGQAAMIQRYAATPFVADFNQQVAQFIQHYGGMMRRVYCSQVCSCREECALRRKWEEVAAA